MQAIAETNPDRFRAYRRRLAAKGWRQIIAELPDETVAMIDALKERQGLRSRSQALLQLIEQGRQAAQ
jgi:Ribbon-helix-helix protein, copG family